MMVDVSAKQFALRTKMSQNRRFVACWANLFAEMPVEGLCRADFVAGQQP